MSIADELRANIPDIIQDCASVEDFLTHVGRYNVGLRLCFELLPEVRRSQRVDELKTALHELIDFDRWEKLSSSPSTLDGELEKVLRRVKAATKNLYAIPKHRPIKNTDRDQKILQTRKLNPSLSFAQLGIKVGLGPGGTKIAERVVKRAQDRERKKLRQFLELIANIVDSTFKPAATTASARPRE